jgi:YebC/PmpR family DNA-binding regulatory protein
MSGHSKWSTIKRKKGATDAKRGAIFTRLSKDITLASKDGGSDIEMNPALRLAVKKAKSSNMPSANIEKAIKKGSGELPGIKYENYIYEGYGPSGVAIMMEVMTDNKNRTVPEIRHIMSKNGGNLGEAGCVNWMFEKKGTITINQLDLTSEEELMDLSIEIDAEDFISEDDYFEIRTQPEKFNKTVELLDQKKYEYEGEIGLVPTNMVKVSEDDSKSIIKLLELLEDHEDIQKIYSNFEVE